MERIGSEILGAFNKTRKIRNAALCYAPFVALNFDQSGDITVCCFNRTFVLGKYPDDTVKDAWNSPKMQELRAAMKENDAQKGCQQCAKMLQAGNFEGVLIKQFDHYASISPYAKKSWFWRGNSKLTVDLPKKELFPTIFEFELNNTCNLECIMCGGKWSSAIRKNREHLPAIKGPYDEAFVEQVKDFLPTLQRANFLGGEPFMISIYYEIWEAMIAINPQIEISITSNGTMLNKRAKEILMKLPHCKVTLSIDSLNKKTWEYIRRNGVFEDLQDNIIWLLENKKLVSFSICPMIQNWEEIPSLIDFCERHQLDVFFNTVHEPLGGRKEGIHKGANATLPEVSLSMLDAEALTEIIRFYQMYQFGERYQQPLNDLIRQLEFWKTHKTVAC